MQWLKSMWLPTFIGFLLTLVIFFPMLQNPDTMTTSPNDGPIIAWLINQVGLQVVANESIYDLPFFHPYQSTLTYSVPFLSTALLNLPLSLFSDQLILNLNIHLLLGSVLTFLAMFVLARELFQNKLAEYAGAFFFAFSYLHLEFAVHLQSFLVAGIPFGVYFLLKYVGTKRYRYLLGFSLAYLYQVLNDPMTAYFFMIIIAVLIFVESWWRKLIMDKIFLGHLLLLFFVSVIFYFPYVLTSQELGTIRTIRDTAHSSYGLERLWGFDLMMMLLVLIGLSLFRVKSQDSPQPVISFWSLSTIMLFGLFYMLGPVMKIFGETWKPLGFAIPLPYAVTYYLWPGMNAFRAVTRWSVLLNFGMALWIGSWVNQSRLKDKWLIIALAVSAIAMIVYSSMRMEFFVIQTRQPAIYEKVKNADGDVLIELPIYLWDMTPYDSVEDERLLYQAYHEKKLFNGVSGLVPPQRITEIQDLIREFPNEQSIEVLQKNQVELVLIHYGEYQQMFDDNFTYAGLAAVNSSFLRETVNHIPTLSLIACDIDDCLYRMNVD